MDDTNNPSLTILIPTYNRAKDLQQTLDAMCRVDISELKVNFFVIENGLRNCTQQVVEDFGERLPIRYLYEPMPGKNNALNKAINEVELGQIVVFTDDDVTPKPDWLKQIVGATERWSQYDIFGGAINSLWPYGQPPKWWGAGPNGERWNLAGHGQFSKEECIYPSNCAPCGPNMWIRKKVFDKGYRFDGSIGPNAKINVMGDEGSFLHMLRKEGYKFVYSPYPVVGHRIQRELLSPLGIKKRIISEGRGSVRIYGLPRDLLLKRSRLLWCGHRLFALIFALLRYCNPINYLNANRGYAARLEAIGDIAYNIESFRIFWESSKPGWISFPKKCKELNK
ncbi:MAG: glycosyltransferase family 2 protein [Sedimentisphaerales bacterium]|nr:glycosyltransferase family 2 protein [Sedimentisphaerales bacterium]